MSLRFWLESLKSAILSMPVSGCHLRSVFKPFPTTASASSLRILASSLSTEKSTCQSEVAWTRVMRMSREFRKLRSLIIWRPSSNLHSWFTWSVELLKTSMLKHLSLNLSPTSRGLSLPRSNWTSLDLAGMRLIPTMFNSKTNLRKIMLKLHWSPMKTSPISPPEKNPFLETARPPTLSTSCLSTGLWSWNSSGRMKRRCSTNKMKFAPRDMKFVRERITSESPRPRTLTTATSAHFTRGLLELRADVMEASPHALTSSP